MGEALATVLSVVAAIVGAFAIGYARGRRRTATERWVDSLRDAERSTRPQAAVLTFRARNDEHEIGGIG